LTIPITGGVAVGIGVSVGVGGIGVIDGVEVNVGNGVRVEDIVAVWGGVSANDANVAVAISVSFSWPPSPKEQAVSSRMPM
jgi:hypothetical protein